MMWEKDLIMKFALQNHVVSIIWFQPVMGTSESRS